MLHYFQLDVGDDEAEDYFSYSELDSETSSGSAVDESVTMRMMIPRMIRAANTDEDDLQPPVQPAALQFYRSEQTNFGTSHHRGSIWSVKDCTVSQKKTAAPVLFFA